MKTILMTMTNNQLTPEWIATYSQKSFLQVAITYKLSHNRSDRRRLRNNCLTMILHCP